MNSITLQPPDEAVLFTRAEALQAGWKDHHLRSPRFQRVIHGIYTLADTSITHELKCHAAAIALPEDAIITGRSAATLHGIPLAGRNDNVEVLVTDYRYMNRRGGLRCWSRKSSPDEHQPWHGIQLATPARAAFDLLTRHKFRAGIAFCDALLHSGLLTEDNLAWFLGSRRYYGIRTARRAFELLDGRSESIPESVLRVALVQAGLHPVPQVEVFDGREFVARLDLAFEATKVAVEYDGAWHGNPDQAQRDRLRRERLRAIGWRVIVVTSERLHNDLDGVIAEVRQVLTERG